MKITDEAVEAAAKALDQMRANPATLMDYLLSEKVARAALEAAAPHMLAEAVHVNCDDCGKCRAVMAAETWCGYCDYWSCERGPDCSSQDIPDPHVTGGAS